MSVIPAVKEPDIPLPGFTNDVELVLLLMLLDEAELPFP